MAFVVEEVSLAAPRLPETGMARRSLPEWLSKCAAALLSLGIVSLLLAGLMLAGVMPSPTALLQKQGLLIVDLVSPSQSEAGSMKSHSAPLSQPTAEASRVDAAAPTESPTEWSVSKLPPLPSKSVAPAAAETPASGLATVGDKSGGGIDPYAFASYQPNLVRQAIGAGLEPKADALARIEKLIRQRLIERQIAINLRLTVARDGRVTHADVTGPIAVEEQAIVANIVTGTALFSAEATRQDGAQANITLNV